MSSSRRLPHVSHVRRYGGFFSASATQWSTCLLRTLSPNADSSGAIDRAMFVGRKSDSERCRATSSYSWFRTWGGLWKNPLVELDGSAKRLEVWEVGSGICGGSCRDWGLDEGGLGYELVAISSDSFNSSNVSMVFLARAVSSYSHIEDIVLNSLNRGFSNTKPFALEYLQEGLCRA